LDEQEGAVERLRKVLANLVSSGADPEHIAPEDVLFLD
jgi:uncharacterized protein YoaH (UPF0181 family)